MRINSLASNR